MNNEPVAWIIKYDDSVCEFGNISQSKEELQKEIDECTKNVPHWNHGTIIPLYTHPAKTLTDEEIAQEWGNFCPNVLEFARAILRKAQEK
jgi:hypothetical protein